MNLQDYLNLEMQKQFSFTINGAFLQNAETKLFVSQNFINNNKQQQKFLHRYYFLNIFQEK